MTRFLLRRALASIPVLWAALTIVFAALRFTPGTPLAVLLAESGSSQSQAAALSAQLGLDRPFADQYLSYLADLAHGQLGRSLFNSRPVAELIRSQAAPTLQLAACAMVVAVVLGLGIGAAGTARPGSGLARTAALATALCQALPVAWTGLLALWFVGAILHWPSNYFSALALPALTLGLSAAGPLAAVTRSSLLSVRSEWHVLAARARGISGWRLFSHIGRAALVPVIHLAGLQSAFLFSGTVLTETVFARPGLGRLLVDSLLRKDYPVVQGLTLWIAALYLLFNLAADLLGGALDPRVRTQWH